MCAEPASPAKTSAKGCGLRKLLNTAFATMTTILSAIFTAPPRPPLKFLQPSTTSAYYCKHSSYCSYWIKPSSWQKPLRNNISKSHRFFLQLRSRLMLLHFTGQTLQWKSCLWDMSITPTELSNFYSTLCGDAHAIVAQAYWHLMHWDCWWHTTETAERELLRAEDRTSSQ